jgi:hypothetical protein
VKRDRALEVLMSRPFAVVYNAVMCVAFAAVAWFLSEPGSLAQLFWTFGCGVHAGFTFMWLIAPHINERWRRQMQTEIELMMSRAMLQAIRDGGAVAPGLVPDDDLPPHGRRLQ